jgi:hypothetical protein
MWNRKAPPYSTRPELEGYAEAEALYDHASGVSGLQVSQGRVVAKAPLPNLRVARGARPRATSADGDRRAEKRTAVDQRPKRIHAALDMSLGKCDGGVVHIVPHNPEEINNGVHHRVRE